MLKWVGCVIIFASCCGLGFVKSNEFQSHLDELEEVKKLFYLLRSELQYTRATFGDTFLKVSSKTKAPYQEWLIHLSQQLNDKARGSFWEIWCQTISEHLKHGKLREDELEELKDIGKNLEYLESLDLYIEQLEYKIKHTREECRTKRKLCRSMGIIGGIFLVILLL